MAEFETTPIREAASDETGAPFRSPTPEDTEAITPAEGWTQENELAPIPEAAPPPGAPLRDDELLHYSGTLLRDELATAQADPEAARTLAARHWSRLLYSPNAPWRGRTPYPQVSLPKPDKQTP